MYTDLRAQAVKDDVILVGLRSAKKFECSSSTNLQFNKLMTTRSANRTSSLLSH